MADEIDHELLRELPGGPALIDWFGGRLPSLHDAEVIGVALDRNKSSCTLKIHAFERATDPGAENKRIFVKHSVVTFQFTEVTTLRLEDFNHQNVIDGITLSRKLDGTIALTLEPCWGLWGEVEAKTLHVSFEPGIPSGSSFLPGDCKEA